MRKIIFLILFISSCFINAQERKPYHIYNDKYEMYSTEDKANFKKLLGTPEKYNGKHIQLKGYLIINNGNAVFFKNKKESLNNGNVSKYNLLLTKEDANFLEESCSNKKVVIFGYFNQDSDDYNGTFSKVCIIPLSDFRN